MISEQEIHDICKKYDITNYSINPDGSINVRGNVNLSYMALLKLPLEFNIVHGHFYCDSNKLTSLNKFPKFVGGDCNVSYNNLTSLKGSIEYVVGYFDCSCNKLTSLKGSLMGVGYVFYCSYNQLTSLEGCPKDIKDKFHCDNNPLESLKGYDLPYEQLICNDKLKLIRKHKINKTLDIL